MYTIKKQIHFCYGHRLLNYDGPCKNLHGHNAIVQFELSSDQCNSTGMVQDFSEIKQIMEKWIIQNLDHRMLLCKNDPYIPLLQQRKEPIVILQSNPTAETLAKLLYHQAHKLNLSVSKVTVWETSSSCASYSDDP